MIHELRDRGYQIVGIAGSSMGALVGGLQAAERLDEFADWARSLTQRAILRLLDPSITAAGVLRAEKILDAVRDILGASTIEQLSIPYTAVATDLLAGKSVWLQRGPVDEAIRASIAIPGVIAPHVVDGRLLADGGILDPLPMAPISAVNADLTIAVSLSGSEIVGDAEPEPRPTTEWLNRMLSSTSALFDTAAARSLLDRPTARAVLNRFGVGDPESDIEAEADEEPDVPKLGGFEVMNRTIDIAQAALARHTLAAYPPDLLIEVPRSACRGLEFHRAAEVIDIGRALAAHALDTLDTTHPTRRHPAEPEGISHGTSDFTRRRGAGSTVATARCARYALERLRGLVRSPVDVYPAEPTALAIDNNVAIPTRDGTVLRVNVYRPPDGGPFAVLLCAHPYGKDNLPTKKKRGRGYSVSIQYQVLRQPTRLRFSDLTGWEAPDPVWWTEHGFAVVNCDLRGAGQIRWSRLIAVRSGRRGCLRRYRVGGAPTVVHRRGGHARCLLSCHLAVESAALRPPHLAAIVPWEGFTDAYRDFARTGGIRETGFLTIWSRDLGSAG